MYFQQFFSPLDPSDIRIMYETSGRPSGNAKVFFSSKEEMTRALGKVRLVKIWPVYGSI